MADEHRYVFIYNFSSYDNDWKGFSSRLPTWCMMMTASFLAKILKVWCWHDRSNQSYGRYNVIWRHFIFGQWPWDLLDGHFQCKSTAAPKGLKFPSSTCRFCGDVVSPSVTEHWANHGTTRKHYQPQRSVFSAGCPTTTESAELGWKKTCILELSYSRKQNREHVCMRLY